MTIFWEDQFAQRTRSMKSSAIRELLKITEQPDIISFGGGLPAPESFPYERFGEACQKVLGAHGAQALQYGATEGYRPLRELIAERTRREGLPVTAGNVLITSGSQQALDLLGKVFINPGSRIVIEAPTYLGALQAWNAYEAEYILIPSDADGIDPSALEATLRQLPRFIYVLPNFQNPSGVTLAGKRRQEVVRLAHAFGIPVVEDDPYRQLRFEGQDLPSLMSLDYQCGEHQSFNDGGVIYLSTFSKILSPGIRLGWVIAPESVIRKMTIAKQGMDLHTSSFIQMVAYEMEKDGYIETHAHKIQAMYRVRRDAMLAALDTYFPAQVEWTNPQGGLFLWCTLPPEFEAEGLLTQAIQQKVAFVPGTPFYPNGLGKNQMRLNFSYSSPHDIREGIARLGSLLQQHEKVRG